MNILITGGAGFIGSHLAELLLTSGHQVTAFDNLSTGNTDNLENLSNHPNFTMIRGDILNPEDLAEPVGTAELVYHLAASVGVRYVLDNPVSALEINTQGTSNLMKAARDTGGKKVVLASSSEVYGRSSNLPYREDDVLSLGPTSVPRWGYACSKMLDEFLALAHRKESNLPVIVLRLFNTVGPRQSGSYGMVIPRMVAQCLNNQPVTVYGDGSQTRCFGYVGDVAQAMIDIANSPEAEGEVFNLGNDVEISILALAELIKETLNSTSPIELVPFESVYGSDFQDIPRRIPDLNKIKKYIEYDPNTDLSQIIKGIADQLNKNNPVDSRGQSH